MKFWTQLSALFRKKKLDAEMAEEMHLHIELQAEQNIKAGMDPDEARYAARRKFGGVEQVKEQCRDQRGIAWFSDSWTDLRYGLRQLRKAPGFTTVAILTLAIGIGATTAIFSIVNSVILRPLDFPQSDQLVVLRETYHPDERPGAVSWAAYSCWSERAISFSSIAATRYGSGNLVGAGDPERVSVLQVTTNYFATLGVQPMIGRGFLPEEVTGGHGNVMVMNHWYWLKKFDGAADVIGRKIQFNDEVFTIIGVLPRNAQLDTASPIFVPIIATAADRENHFATRDSADVIGRLKPGVSIVEAASEMEVLASAMGAEFPATNKGRGVRITSLLEQTVATTGGYGMKGANSLLFLLLGAVGFLLLIACVNIANLLLARASTRRKEIAVRAALGASRTRIIRQLLCESLLLAVLGGSLGAVLAYWSLDLLKPLTGYLPRAGEISLDGWALAFSLIITVLTGIGFGLVPAWQAMKVDVLDGLKEGGQANDRGRSQRMRSSFIITEVALALILLTGAGLLIKSFVHLQNVELGFETEGIYGNRFELPPKKYSTPQQQTAFVEHVLERISSLSTVSSAAFTTGMPVFGSLGGAFKIAGRPEEPNEQIRGVLYAAATPEYFKTLGIPVIRGRDFSSNDTASAPRVAIISARVAEKYFPDQDPIGQRISRLTRSKESETWLEIVGVVGDVKQWGPASDTIREKPEGVYEPFAQNPTVLNLLLVVRTRVGKTDLPIALRAVIQSVDTNMPLTRMFHLADGVNESISRYRLSMFILALFAGIAVLLAAIGVYGVMAYAVTQRTHEIGVRMAIGAQRGDILRLIFSQAGKLVGIGLVIGLAGSLAGSRLLRALLFEVSPQDPVTLVVVAVVLVSVAVAACWIPARRAARVDPMVALRCE